MSESTLKDIVEPAQTPEDAPEGMSASPPPVALLQMMTGYWVSQAIYVAAKLGIADLLADGPASAEDLAAKTRTHAPSLHRVLRALASVGVFARTEQGGFTLTPMGELLRTGTPGSMRALGIMYNEEQYRAWGELLHSVRTGEPAFEHLFGMGVFQFFAENPEPSRVFNQAMIAWTHQVARAVAETYDFAPFERVVDVGGGHGQLLAAILRKHPGVQGILFDLPHVVASAGEFLETAGVAERCTRVGGDFFVEVPAGGDAYLLAHILHDWDDDRCTTILQRCRRVIPPHGKLLVVELVLPAGDEPSFGKWVDLHMLVMASGRERTAAEYAGLLRGAGFELTRVVPTPAGQSVVEAAPI